MKSSTINTYPAVLHVRFGGKSFDVPLACLDVNPATDDRLIKRALASHLEIPESQLREYVLDRHPNGNLTLRPMAVFG